MRTEQRKAVDSYWKKIFGLELYKVDYKLKQTLYDWFGIRLPKLRSQRQYWKDRGQVYMNEILASGYLEREVFFQNLLIDFLKTVSFDSFFEAGCGFGWNIKRVHDEFPGVRVGGVDFSLTQLQNASDYLKDTGIPVVNGDNCRLPFRDEAFDVGFSLGVFMNIHPEKIESAIQELIRVSGRYIVHLEYDEDHTTPELKEKRAFKTNIISHDYQKLYQKAGLKVIDFRTYHDFGGDFDRHVQAVRRSIDRWEGLEGAEKYIFIVLEKPGVDRGKSN